MRYRDENGKFCSKEKWESLQNDEENINIPLPTIVTVCVLCVIVLYEVWGIGITGWWK